MKNSMGGWCGECCLLSGCADAAMGLFGLPAIAQVVTRFMLRMEVVRKYGIEEDGCQTFFCVFFCAPCAMCQQTNELFEREGLRFDGFGACKDQPTELTVLVAAA